MAEPENVSQTVLDALVNGEITGTEYLGHLKDGLIVPPIFFSFKSSFAELKRRGIITKNEAKQIDRWIFGHIDLGIEFNPDLEVPVFPVDLIDKRTTEIEELADLIVTASDLTGQEIIDSPKAGGADAVAREKTRVAQTVEEIDDATGEPDAEDEDDPPVDVAEILLQDVKIEIQGVGEVVVLFDQNGTFIEAVLPRDLVMDELNKELLLLQIKNATQDFDLRAAESASGIALNEGRLVLEEGELVFRQDEAIAARQDKAKADTTAAALARQDQINVATSLEIERDRLLFESGPLGFAIITAKRLKQRTVDLSDLDIPFNEDVRRLFGISGDTLNISGAETFEQAVGTPLGEQSQPGQGGVDTDFGITETFDVGGEIPDIVNNVLSGRLLAGLDSGGRKDLAATLQVAGLDAVDIEETLAGRASPRGLPFFATAGRR